MAKISLDIASLKSAGVYTFEFDNSIRTSTVDSTTLRLLVGFNPKGPFNRPVLVTSDTTRERLFGPIDTKLEHKGCFFNRFAQILLAKGPFLALNLLKTDESENGPDQVNFASMSLNAGLPNPEVISAGKYGEYDYLNNLDASIYGDTTNYIPYIGKTPYASLFDRSRFWQASEHNLTAVAANKLQTGDTTSFEHTNFLNFANLGTEELSILVYKPENLSGYNITAAEWYNGAENIPYGWIRPSDYISDYFLTVICVKGNWSNSPALNVDPIWYSYFDKYGLLKSKINSFCGAEGVTLLGVWTGSIIPDFTDKQGNSQALLQKVNNSTEVTGLMMSLNEDALQVLNYDYNGVADEGEETGSGCWFFDIDGDNQMTTSQGESQAGTFLVDMVGHNFQSGIRNDGTADTSVSLDSSFVATYGDTSLYYLPNYESIVASGGSSDSLFNDGVLTAINGSFAVNFDAVIIDHSEYLTYTGSAETTTTVDNSSALYVAASTLNSSADNESASLKITYAVNSSVSGDETVPSVLLTVAPTSEQYVDSSTIALLNNGLEYTLTAIKKYATDEVLINTSTFAFENKGTDASPSYQYEFLMGKKYADLLNSSISSINLDVNVKASTETTTDEATVNVNALNSTGNTVYFTSIKSVGDNQNKTTVDVIDVESNQISSSTGTPYGTYLGVTSDTTGNYTYSLYKLYAKTTSRKTVDTFELIGSVEPYDEKLPSLGNQVSFNYPVTGTQKVQYVYSNVYPTTGTKAEFGGIATALNSGSVNKIYGIDFLSYNYVNASTANVVSDVAYVEYFNDTTKFISTDGTETAPVSSDTYNIFAVTDADEATKIVVGDFINNIAFDNAAGEALRYNTIPGITRVTSKVFVNVAADGSFTYKGKTYKYTGTNLIINVALGVRGFYLYTTIDGVKKYSKTLDYALYGDVKNHITLNGVVTALADNTHLIPVYDTTDSTKIVTFELESGVDVATVDDSSAVTLATTGAVKKQLPISDSTISQSLRFIPLKGLKITGRHRPGYDESGNIDIEGGIEKVYSMLEDEGILRGLCNEEMADFRYIVDSMSYGVRSELGGKVHLSKLAKAKGKCLAILNMPSVRQFTNSQNPYFCDTYTSGTQVKPSFNTKYIPQGGNVELYSTNVFSLPTEDDGSKFAAAFFPHLKYLYNNKTILVPPAADVANTLVNKFTSGDPYMICANLNGILNNSGITGVEYVADQTDRDYLEPFGVNTIISRGDNVMIYGNQTCYQTVKSDLNKLHIRENLNTIEIAVDNALKDFVFEYNNATTRATIVSKITPYFNNMLLSGALESFNIVCDETNNTADIIEEDILIVDTEVQFTHGAEKIVHRITVNRVGSTSD